MNRENHVLTQAGNATFRGVRSQGVVCYSAIPFANPPVGAARFTAPTPADLRGAIDCTKIGNAAPQLQSPLSRALGQIEVSQSEDCLHLTVWKPAHAEHPLPVVIWIHGGAYQSGSAGISWYDGSDLARRGNMVVVSINYRLGSLGWLHAPGFGGNLGLLDIELGVHWVWDHIHHFGGSPQAVTLMGQSSGAMCAVAVLARNPGIERLILQSPPIGREFRTSESAALLGQALLAASGAGQLEQARQLTAAQLLAAQNHPQVLGLLRELNDGQGLFCPVLDDVTLPSTLCFQTLAEQSDVLIGTNRDEMAAFPGFGLDDRSQAATEKIFKAPAEQWAQCAHGNGREAYLYEFGAVFAPEWGACHCVELPFVFGTLEAFQRAPMLSGLDREGASRITADVQRAWISFIRTEPLSWLPPPHVNVIR